MTYNATLGYDPDAPMGEGPRKLLDAVCTSKDRLIDALQAQLRDVREELRSTQHEFSITDAKLEEARRALDRCMGIRL